MLLDVRTSGLFLDPDLRSRCEREAFGAFEELQAHVSQVEMLLAKHVGPRGGVRFTCTVQVRVRRLPLVVEQSASSDLARAIAQAVEYAHTAVDALLTSRRAGAGRLARTADEDGR